MSIDNLMSGFIGSIATALLTLALVYLKVRNGRKNLYRAIGEECLYCLSILDEITHGVVDANGSFKRMPVEFFKAMRQQTVDYGLKSELLRGLSHLIVDLDLFNLEADYKFNGQSDARSYIGEVGTQHIAVVSNQEVKDISATVKAARLGVRGSLENVLKIVAEELGDDTLLDGTYEEE